MGELYLGACPCGYEVEGLTEGCGMAWLNFRRRVPRVGAPKLLLLKIRRSFEAVPAAGEIR